MTLLAVFAILLGSLQWTDDLLIGTPIANRTHEALGNSASVSLFNMLVLRTELSGDPSFQDVLTHVRDVALNAYAHQDLPFEQLVDALQFGTRPEPQPALPGYVPTPTQHVRDN